jgi:flagellar protein FliO/FliZ
MFGAVVLTAIMVVAQVGPPVESSTAAQARAEQEAYERAEQLRLRRLAEELERESGAAGALDADSLRDQPARGETPSLLVQLVKMVFTLGAVCLLAYLLLGKLLPKLLRIEPPVAQRRIMQVIDRLPLDQRRSILVLRIGDQYFLVGASEGGIHLISKLDADEIIGTLAAQDVEKPSLGKLASLLSRKRE